MPDSTDARPPDALISSDDGKQYWAGIDADVNGMLGGIPEAEGFSYVPRVDIQGSRSFLAKIGISRKSSRRKVANALEGGAGIGRITQGLLLDLAEQVDVIEPIAKFTALLDGKSGVRHIFNVGLEDWRPVEGVRYNLIWTQWCVGHLTDQQLVEYLERCRDVLSPDDGVIVIKENLSTSGSDVFDTTDSCVTREDTKFQSIFEQAGLKIVKAEMQKGFPWELLPVKMYALKPKAES